MTRRERVRKRPNARSGQPLRPPTSAIEYTVPGLTEPRRDTSGRPFSPFLTPRSTPSTLWASVHSDRLPGRPLCRIPFPYKQGLLARSRRTSEGEILICFRSRESSEFRCFPLSSLQAKGSQTSPVFLFTAQ